MKPFLKIYLFTFIFTLILNHPNLSAQNVIGGRSKFFKEITDKVNTQLNIQLPGVYFNYAFTWHVNVLDGSNPLKGHLVVYGGGSCSFVKIGNNTYWVKKKFSPDPQSFSASDNGIYFEKIYWENALVKVSSQSYGISKTFSVSANLTWNESANQPRIDFGKVFDIDPVKGYPKDLTIEFLNPGNVSINSFPINQIRTLSEKIKRAEKARIEAEKKASGNTTANSSNSSSSSRNSTPTSKNTISKNSTTSNKTITTNSTKPKTIGNTGKTYEQLEYERKATERQQKDKLQMATNPGGYAMEKSGLNDIYRNANIRANREADAKRAREEKEWAAEKSRRRREQIEENRRAEAYRKQQEENKRKYNLSLEEAYQKKGGDANFNTKLKQFQGFANTKMNYVNTILRKNDGQIHQLNYMDNCSYVKIIENIQLNKQLLPIAKLTLIEEIIAIKVAYVNFYMYNSKNGQNYSNTDYQDNTSNAGCSQYLRNVAFSLLLNNNYYSKRSISISNTNSDFENEYKSKIANFLSNYVFDYYYKGRTGETYTNGRLKFKLEDYLDFCIQKSWTIYGPLDAKYQSYSSDIKNAPLLKDVGQEINKVKLTHELGRKYHTTKDVDELTMAAFNYNHGFLKDALNNMKTYELKISDKKTVAINVQNIESESVISKILGAILYLNNKDYKQALIYLTRLKKFDLEILKRKNSHYKDDEILEKAIVKLENLLFYEVGNYTQMHLPNSKKDLESKYKNKIYDFLKYNNGPLMADALYNMGNKEMAEEIIDKMVSYIKKIFKFNYTYRGTQSEINALKKLLNIFNPKALDKMKFDVENKYTFKKNKEVLNNFYRILEWKFYSDYGTPLKNTVLELKNEPNWLKNKGKEINLLSQAELNQTLDHFLEIYKKGKLEVSEEVKEFLTSLIISGVLTGRFYDVMPAMTDLKNHYDTKDLIVYEKIMVLFTSNVQELSYERFESEEIRNKRWSNPKEYENPTITWFYKNSKDPLIKNSVRQIIEVWTNNGYTHVLIPFLYEFQK